jgi:hypothetical protein
MEEHRPKKPIGSSWGLSYLFRAKPERANRTHVICLEHRRKQRAGTACK